MLHLANYHLEKRRKREQKNRASDRSKQPEELWDEERIRQYLLRLRPDLSLVNKYGEPCGGIQRSRKRKIAAK